MFIFDQCVRDLELNGYALLPLPKVLQQTGERGTKTSVIAQAFDSARRALGAVSDDADAAPLVIDPSTDSGGWTGYHNAAAVNGRYNQYREGFVFSNGGMFDVVLNGEEDDCINFEHEMNELFGVMHDDVAEGVLRAIERRLELPHCYFQREVGPTNISSQWHMKRYVVDVQRGTSSNSDDDVAEKQDASNENDVVLPRPRKEDDIFLSVHTDPSLISVVILDRVGENKGGMGLEVFHPAKIQNDSNSDSTGRHRYLHSGTWEEVSHHGHDVAVIFVGSVLSYLTKGHIFSAAKHRVVNWDTTCRTDANTFMDARMAATLFVRPHANALMRTLPSPHLKVGEAKKNPPTFRVWNARVARNYMKKKQGKKSKDIQ